MLGSMRWREILGPAFVSLRSAQHYTHFNCLWPISIPLRYKLSVEFVSEENGECVHSDAFSCNYDVSVSPD